MNLPTDPDMAPHCTGTIWPQSPCPQSMFKCIQLGPHCTGTSSSDIWWQQLETCSNLFTWGPPGANIWWLLKPIWSTSGQYVSYWNTFLLQMNQQYKKMASHAIVNKPLHDRLRYQFLTLTTIHRVIKFFSFILQNTIRNTLYYWRYVFSVEPYLSVDLRSHWIQWR